jgi:hypothetical protein
MTSYMIVGDNEEPIGMVDMDIITTEGTKFAFALAAACNDEQAVARIQAETLARVGTKSFGYVCANALGVMTTEILAPTFEVTRTYGTDLQEGMRRIAAGETP